VVAVAHDHPKAIIVADIGELVNIGRDLGLQRCREHLPCTVADQLVQQRPRRCGRRLLRTFSSNYREHGRTFPTGVDAPALLEGIQGSSGRYAHQARQPEISNPQVLIIARKQGAAAVIRSVLDVSAATAAISSSIASGSSCPGFARHQAGEPGSATPPS